MCTQSAFSLPAASSPHSSSRMRSVGTTRSTCMSSRASKCALLVRAEIDPMTVSVRFERAEDTELHHVPPADHRSTYTELNSCPRLLERLQLSVQSRGRRFRHEHNTDSNHAENPAPVLLGSRRPPWRSCWARSPIVASTTFATCRVWFEQHDHGVDGDSRRSTLPTRDDARRPRLLRQLGRSGPTSTATWSLHSTGPVSRRQPPGMGRLARQRRPDGRFPVRPEQPTGVRLRRTNHGDARRVRRSESRRESQPARSCPEVPAATVFVTIDGEPAIVDEVNCGVFALSATVIHAGRRLCVLHVRSAGQGSRDAGVVRIVDPSRCVRDVAPLPTSGDATSRSSRARRLLSVNPKRPFEGVVAAHGGDRAAGLSRLYWARRTRRTRGLKHFFRHSGPTRICQPTPTSRRGSSPSPIARRLISAAPDRDGRLRVHDLPETASPPERATGDTDLADALARLPDKQKQVDRLPLPRRPAVRRDRHDSRRQRRCCPTRRCGRHRQPQTRLPTPLRPERTNIMNTHEDDLIHDIERAYPSDETELVRLHARLVEAAQSDGILDVDYRTVDSPVGTLLLAATELGLVRVAYDSRGPRCGPADARRPDQPSRPAAPARLDAVARELDEYFAGRRRAFDVPLDRRLVHGFRRTVLTHLSDIAYGHTASYATVARSPATRRRCAPSAPRARTNPLPVVVPCHRVAPQPTERLGGYLGGVEAKRTLLALEAARMSTQPRTRRRDRMVDGRGRARRPRDRGDRPDARRRRVPRLIDALRRQPTVPVDDRHGPPPFRSKASTGTSTSPARAIVAELRAAFWPHLLPIARELGRRRGQPLRGPTLRRVDRPMPRGRAVATDAVDAALRTGRLERAAPRPLRRPGLPAAGRDRSRRPERRLHRRRVRRRRATPTGAVTRRRRSRSLMATASSSPPATARSARRAGWTAAPMRHGVSVVRSGQSPHPRSGLPRRRMTTRVQRFRRRASRLWMALPTIVERSDSLSDSSAAGASRRRRSSRLAATACHSPAIDPTPASSPRTDPPNDSVIVRTS